MPHEIKIDVKSRVKVGRHTLFSRLKNYSVGLLVVSFLSALFSSFGANYIVENFLPHDKKNIENTIQGKVLELEEAKITLVNLIKFINKQQDSLHELSANLEKIKQEKKRLNRCCL
ncbi:hypothetical protein [Solidesulfovibrio alcoholivorans]|uniref:hypothetical protein n=1 Tax=Solidesulfovibrio alcoholivorans TaxID=81406 RepID=UPI0012EBFFCC|nr:hypothetical protein [Solidesulfovibrio alcoholivorans]